MTNTTHYSLKKPEDSDNVLIGDLNENADAIDQALHGLEEGKAAKTKPAKAGSLAALDGSGNLTDSGRAPGAAGGVATLDESGKVPGAQLPEMDYDPAGSAAAVKKALNSHTGNRQNPHGVTAKQAGADPAGTASSAVSTHNQDGAAHAELLADNVQLKTAKVALPYSDNWKDITYGNGVFVAVRQRPGEADIAYSPDGATWSNVITSVEYGSSVAYGNGKFVVIGKYGATAYSTDGKQWTVGQAIPGSGNWAKVAYGNGKFVAVSDSSNAAYSADGINWTATSMPAMKSWAHIAYGNERFVAITDNSNYVAYSTDGINWTASRLKTSGSWQDITYGNGKFVAVKYNSGYGAWSTDGISWTEDLYLGDANPWKAIAYGNDRFVAIAINGKSAYLLDAGGGGSSPPTSLLKNCAAVAFGGGKFVTVPSTGNQVAISADGGNWVAEVDVVCRPDGTSIAEAFSAALGAAKIEIGSYVGTGTYGSSNPLSITTQFDANLISIIATEATESTIPNVFTSGGAACPVIMSHVGTDWTRGIGFSLNGTDQTNTWAKKSTDGKTLFWYGNYLDDCANESGRTYHYIAIKF